jgi:FlaA1/EpsC-like NDP-sugar epimerase
MNQAIELVREATSFPETGVVIVPKPPAMSMRALVNALDPNREVVVIGARSGEKQHEMLINSSEALHTRDIGKRFVIFAPNDTDEGNLPAGFEYSSVAPNHWVMPDELHKMLDSYNPYGGREWNTRPLH